MVSAEVLVELTDLTWERFVEKGDKPAVVMFYSQACPYCRAMEPYFRSYAAEYGDRILFARVDITASLWIAERYGVRGTPTFKFFCSGRPVSELVGSVYPAILKKMVEEVILHGKDCIARSTAINYDITGYG